jgi:hypothetical protein
MSITTIVNHIMLGTLAGTDSYFQPGAPRPTRPARITASAKTARSTSTSPTPTWPISNGPIHEPNLLLYPGWPTSRHGT